MTSGHLNGPTDTHPAVQGGKKDILKENKRNSLADYFSHR